MKTTSLKLVAFFVLVSSVLAGCSKSDPIPAYSGIYRVTISESYSNNGGPFIKNINDSGNLEVSGGVNPNTVIFIDDQGIIRPSNIYAPKRIDI